MAGCRKGFSLVEITVVLVILGLAAGTVALNYRGPLRDLGLRDAADAEIFDRARAMKAVVMTKDQDFLDLLERFGPPPQIIWITCGNTSNAHLKTILAQHLPQALVLLAQGEPLVEIAGE